MIHTIAPFWDGNETWLVLALLALYAAFPPVFATMLQSLYFPFIILGLMLILRGVAFEFRYSTRGYARARWEIVLAGSSLGSTLAQGYIGFHFLNGVTTHTHAHKFLAAFFAVKLVLLYWVLGVGWLIARNKASQKSWQTFYRYKLSGPFILLGLIFVMTLGKTPNALTERLLTHPQTAAINTLLAVAVTCFALSPFLASRFRWAVFLLCTIGSLTTFAAMGVGFWPYVLPGVYTVSEAAAPPESLNFLTPGAAFVIFPMVLFYQLFVFRWYKNRPECA